MGPDELEIEALTDNLPKVLEFIDTKLEELECSMKAQMQIDIAVEEIFVNIANYAYAPEVGMATIRIEADESPTAVKITFIDKGVPYDPLKKDDPDVTSLQHFYTLLLDWDARNKAGLEPIKPYAEDLMSVSSIEEMTRYYADPDRNIFGTPMVSRKW